MYFPFEAISIPFSLKKKYSLSSITLRARVPLDFQIFKKCWPQGLLQARYSESVICILGVYLLSNDYHSLFSPTAEDKSPGPCFLSLQTFLPRSKRPFRRTQIKLHRVSINVCWVGIWWGSPLTPGISWICPQTVPKASDGLWENEVLSSTRVTIHTATSCLVSQAVHTSLQYQKCLHLDKKYIYGPHEDKDFWGVYFVHWCECQE